MDHPLDGDPFALGFSFNCSYVLGFRLKKMDYSCGMTFIIKSVHYLVQNLPNENVYSIGTSILVYRNTYMYYKIYYMIISKYNITLICSFDGLITFEESVRFIWPLSLRLYPFRITDRLTDSFNLAINFSGKNRSCTLL